jgi:hypothetical protein
MRIAGQNVPFQDRDTIGGLPAFWFRLTLAAANKIEVG